MRRDGILSPELVREGDEAAAHSGSKRLPVAAFFEMIEQRPIKLVEYMLRVKVCVVIS